MSPSLDQDAALPNHEAGPATGGGHPGRDRSARAHVNGRVVGRGTRGLVGQLFGQLFGRMVGRKFRSLCGPGLAAALVVGCGGSSGEPELSPAAAVGKAVAQTKGCASCHVFYGRDAAGPTWKDVYGSEVTLVDGSKVAADDAYLTRSIKDPWAQKVKGFGTIMPRNKLTDEEVASIVTYIKELSPNGQPGVTGVTATDASRSDGTAP